MKQLFRNSILALFVTFSVPAFSSNTLIPEKPSVITEQQIIERNQKLLDRLKEIEALDKTKLSRAEKKELRKEVKEIKQQMAIGGGVYLSIGAIILILILLLILL